MKKKIAILGSTGSIGKTLLSIIDKDKSNFEVVLLSAKKNYTTLIKQAKKYNVKNLILTDLKTYKNISYHSKNSKYKIYNNFDCFKKIFNKKIHYSIFNNS